MERDLFCLLEFDPRVASFEQQPVRITYRDGAGKSRTYTPDVLVHFTEAAGRAPRLCEVKPQAVLRSRPDEIARLRDAGRSYAEAQGWKFLVVTDRRLRTAYLKNVQFLLPFRHHPSAPAEERLLLEILAGGPVCVRDLLHRASADPLRRAEITPLLWRLIATFAVHADLVRPLIPQTVLSLPTPRQAGA